MVSITKQCLKIISVPNIKNDFSSLDEGYDVMKTDDKSG